MTRRKLHRLKDILIDHVFDYCYNEVVKKFKSEGFNFSTDDSNSFKDPFIKYLIEQSLKSGDGKYYSSTRDTEYCKILIDNGVVHKTLTERLKSQGFNKGKKLFERIGKAQSELISKSYFIRNSPQIGEVKLTEKGLKHYLEGKSFEDAFILKRHSNYALGISIISIIIAIIAIIVSMFIRNSINI